MMYNKKKTEDKDTEFVIADYHSMSNDELQKLLFNQIIAQSLREIPQASIVLLASKLVGLEDKQSKEESESDKYKNMSTEDLIEHVKKYTI